MVKVGPNDGATRIWVCDGAGIPAGVVVGLHRHEGEEIFHVRRGTVRFHIAGKNIDVPGGHYVVVTPGTEHGFKVLTPDAELEFIGEIGMGEWVTVLDEDGSRQEIEVRSTFMPWHRSPVEGEEPTDFASMLSMLQSTSHLLDQDPEEEHHPQ
jgi:mannose-6-phosphate isomerase-like protein (cupin superfamily)